MVVTKAYLSIYVGSVVEEIFLFEESDPACDAAGHVLYVCRERYVSICPAHPSVRHGLTGVDEVE